MTEYIVELNSNVVSGNKFLLGTVYLDATPVVRCRDCCCMHRVDGRCVCIRWQFATTPDGFCAWGESTERACECGWHGFVDGGGYDPPNFCPNCGGKAVG